MLKLHLIPAVLIMIFSVAFFFMQKGGGADTGWVNGPCGNRTVGR